ncbi:MAG: hypothetical protein KKC68_05350, partial [Candidatus Thermoplasmatota archaeon]|nr:hypothetical protein [Candidatus Thermoplasmatota archaeon]MBU1941180.1 hypothetical protein [Candidatus Thermoplasmatota archaeon]
MSVEAADQKTDKQPKKTLDIAAIEKSIDQILLEKTKQKPLTTPIPPPLTPTTQPPQQPPQPKTYTPQPPKQPAIQTLNTQTQTNTPQPPDPEPRKHQSTTIPFPPTPTTNSQTPQPLPAPTPKSTQPPPLFTTSSEPPELLDPNIFHPENSSRPSIYAIKKKPTTQTQPSTKESAHPLQQTSKHHPKKTLHTFLEKIHHTLTKKETPPSTKNLKKDKQLSFITKFKHAAQKPLTFPKLTKIPKTSTKKSKFSFTKHTPKHTPTPSQQIQKQLLPQPSSQTSHSLDSPINDQDVYQIKQGESSWLDQQINQTNFLDQQGPYTDTGTKLSTKNKIAKTLHLQKK